MSDKIVKASVYGQEIDLIWSDELQGYVREVTAPGDSSYLHNDGHYFPVTIRATDKANNTTTISDTVGDFQDNLKLYVKEQVKPIIHNVSPAKGTAVNTSTPTFEFDIVDNAGSQTTGFSGINPETIVITVGGKSIGSDKIEKTPIDGGYHCKYMCEDAVPDGDCTFSIDASDHDGNTVEASYTFKVDTVPPTLHISSPNEEISYANTQQITIIGTTADATSSPVQINIFVSIDADELGISQGDVVVGENGHFEKDILLSREGENFITILATDKAGKQNTVKRTVILKTVGPKFRTVEITPSVVNCGNGYTIFVQFEEDEV